jgi:protoporphyrinogen/coproporphyrinogen III oxidase
MRKKFVIIGAGISGLSLGWFLRKRFLPSELEITVLEASDRVGGWIQSQKANNAVFEAGPRSLRADSKIIAILQTLGLEDEIIYASALAKKRYLAKDGKLSKLPDSFASLLTTAYGLKLFKACLLEPFRKKKTEDTDESVFSFFQRRFGKDIADTFIDPMIAGIYASHPHSLSMQSAFPDLVKLEKLYGSVVLGKIRSAKSEQKKLFTLKSGLEILPKTLANKLDAEIELHAQVERIREKGSLVEIFYSGKLILADFVVSTLSCQSFANLLEKDDPLLHSIPKVSETSVAALSFGYKEKYLSQEGFGFLAASSVENELLGIVFDSCVFPEQNGSFQTRLSVMMGGQRAQNILEKSDGELCMQAELFCSKYLSIESRPDFVFVKRAKNAISCYPIGFEEMKVCLKNSLKLRKIELMGAALYGVSVPDCLLYAKTYAENFKF